MNGLELMNGLEMLITLISRSLRKLQTLTNSSPSAFSVHQLAFWKRESPQ